MRGVWSSLFLSAVLTQAASGEEDWSLADRVQVYLLSAAKEAHPDAEISVEVVPLDSRLRLPACDDIDLSRQGDRSYGRMSVAARCNAPTWSVYVTANVSVRQAVVVSRRAISRGSRILASDLALESRDLASLRGGYLTSVAQAAGSSAKQNLAPGSAVEVRDLAAAIVVNRGERVRIASTRGGIVVTAPGEALRAGTSGQQIPVRNLQSDRLVQAWVTGLGTVSTTPAL